VQTLLHSCDSNSVAYLSLIIQECMQTLLLKRWQETKSKCTHTAFLKIFRVVHEKKDKNGSERDYCCDRKARAACAQSFAPWQQATIEIMLAISLTVACSRYTYDGVILHARNVRGESYNECNTTGEVATLPTI